MFKNDKLTSRQTSEAEDWTSFLPLGDSQISILSTFKCFKMFVSYLRNSTLEYLTAHHYQLTSLYFNIWRKYQSLPRTALMYRHNNSLNKLKCSNVANMWPSYLNLQDLRVFEHICIRCEFNWSTFESLKIRPKNQHRDLL